MFLFKAEKYKEAGVLFGLIIFVFYTYMFVDHQYTVANLNNTIQQNYDELQRLAVKYIGNVSSVEEAIPALLHLYDCSIEATESCPEDVPAEIKDEHILRELYLKSLSAFYTGGLHIIAKYVLFVVLLGVFLATSSSFIK
jgi:hypothetical protein